MSDNPSNSSDVSIEEIGPEDEAQEVKKEDDAVELIPPLDDVSIGGRIEEIPANAAEAAAAAQDEANPIQPDPVPAAGAAGDIARRSLLDDSDDDDDSDEEDEDDIDETLVERLVGLTEMFPESVRHGTVSLLSNSLSLAQWSYGMSRVISWVVFSSSVIMFLPIMIETERMGIEEAQKQQQRQILLGPGAAMSAGANAPLPTLPA